MLSRTLTVASTIPLIPLSAPFTRATLATVRDALVPGVNHTRAAVPDPAEPQAAVLVPLCNVNNTPGVLLEVRGKLRSHAGEVSFPGGRADETDPSFLAAALRETQEEVGILPAQIEVVGHFGPPELSLKGLRVWPYVGFVHPRERARSPFTHVSSPHLDSPAVHHTRSDDTLDAPLPSISLASLTISQPEVAAVFHLPLTALATPARLQQRHFRGGRPYWAIDVSDLVPAVTCSPDARRLGRNCGERLEVWGLTGWYLGLLMKLLNIYP